MAFHVLMGRRRRRALIRVARAIRYGLSLPDSTARRQARLLADVFGPQLERRLLEMRCVPLTPHVVPHIGPDAPGSQPCFLEAFQFLPMTMCRVP